MNKPDTDDFYKTKENNINNIIVNETNYLKSETYINKWIFTYNSDTIVSGKLFKNDELKSIFEYYLDKEKNIKEQKVSFYNKSVRNDFSHIKFEKDKNLKLLYLLDINSKLRTKIIVEEDSLHSPIKITNLSSDNEIQSKETADYNYIANTYVYKVYNYLGEIILEKSESYNPNFIIERNEFNDITKMFWPLSKNKVVIIFEYKYDKQGNWIKRTKKRVIDNKKEISSYTTRDIKYK
ncbi:hypothetical protein ACFSJW_01105 [Flavobacterium artemisiae]|uniref:YD repeat-containing protein n=1 Tax=Flavobacterium artemisiae TaxID=2126556 RepID=A0ABW4HIJ4_9FLAO